VRPVLAIQTNSATDDLNDIIGDKEVIIDFNKQYYSLIVNRFGRFVLDKAYKIRNFYIKYIEAIRQARTEGENIKALSTIIIYILTATPIMNRNNDFFEYLILL
jgi:hypothetical protein